MSNTREDNDFSIGSLSAASTFLHGHQIGNNLATPSTHTFSHIGPAALGEESSGFINMLNVSDLEKDELYCKQHWSFLPLEKFNFSVTAIENSKIIPPNFMPAEDSLFQELKGANSESIALNNYLKKYNAEKTQECVLPSQMKVQTDTERGNISTSGIGIPSIQDISLALKSCDDNANPLLFMDEILRAGEKSKTTLEGLKNNGVPSGNYHLTHEDVLLFSSVDLYDIQMRAVHLLNYEEHKNVTFEFKIEGSPVFRILEKYPSCGNDFSMITFNEEIHELFIIFNPACLGPAIATLHVISNRRVKKVKLCGFGGKSNLMILNNVSNMKGTERHILFDDNLKAEFTLKNVGTGPAFYFLDFGPLEYYLYSNENCGIINHTKEKNIQIGITITKVGIIQLLHFFSSDNVTEVGKMRICYGEEASRQRLKRLCLLHNRDDFVLTNTIRRTYPHILLNYSEIPFNLEGMADSHDSIPLLIHEGIHQVDISLLMSKETLKNNLAKMMKNNAYESMHERLSALSFGSNK